MVGSLEERATVEIVSEEAEVSPLQAASCLASPASTSDDWWRRHALLPQAAQQLLEGHTTREATAALFLGPKTVEYLRYVYKKLGVNSRVDLARAMKSAPEPALWRVPSTGLCASIPGRGMVGGARDGGRAWGGFEYRSGRVVVAATTATGMPLFGPSLGFAGPAPRQRQKRSPFDQAVTAGRSLDGGPLAAGSLLSGSSQHQSHLDRVAPRDGATVAGR